MLQCGTRVLPHSRGGRHTSAPIPPGSHTGRLRQDAPNPSLPDVRAKTRMSGTKCARSARALEHAAFVGWQACRVRNSAPYAPRNAPHIALALGVDVAPLTQRRRRSLSLRAGVSGCRSRRKRRESRLRSRRTTPSRAKHARCAKLRVCRGASCPSNFAARLRRDGTRPPKFYRAKTRMSGTKCALGARAREHGTYAMCAVPCMLQCVTCVLTHSRGGRHTSAPRPPVHTQDDSGGTRPTQVYRTCVQKLA